MQIRPSVLHLVCAAAAITAGGFMAGCRSTPVYATSSVSTAGAVKIHQMGGDIKVADAPDGADLGTMGGNIHVGSVGTFAKLHTMGGDITVERASGPVDASTMGGQVKVNSSAGPVKASTMGGDITVHVSSVTGADQAITLSSLGGTVQLTVPKGLGMDVRIKLAYTKNHEEPRIVQHLGLQESQSGDWETHDGTPRKYLYAVGRVGDGRNRVRIDTINGNVIVRQE